MLKNMTLVAVLLLLYGAPRLKAQTVDDASSSVATDVKNDTEIIESDTIQKANKNIFQKIKAYFDESNVEKDEKNFDISFIGGPHYSSDTQLGLGLVASGLYRVDKDDKSISPSNVSLYGDITTTGFYVIGVRSNTIFPKEKYRIDLITFFASQPSKYWGVGYDAGREKDYTKFTGKEVSLKLDLLTKIAPNTFVGVIADYTHRNGTKLRDASYLNGERLTSSYGGAGVSISYDSRDFIPNPYKGFYAKLEYIYYPNFIGNRNTISKTEAIFRAYKQVWDGGILAFDTQGTFMGGTIPWNMMVMTGSSRMMRGYYEGRYRDRMFVGTQVELRQHVWRRNGVAVWAGAGNVFSDFDKFKMKQTLPTFGVGYRWEFKNRVNVRLDYGIGKGESAFYFNINEAF